MKKIKLYKLLIILILVLITAIILLFIFLKPSNVKRPHIVPPTTEQPQVEQKYEFKKDGELKFLKSDSKEIITKIDIEIADNDYKRALGLMFRDTLLPQNGMVFLMGNEEFQGFWMKNTKIPLDIIYVASNYRIVSVHKNTVPYSLDNISSEAPASIVVEVNAGFTDKYNIKADDFISF